MLVSQMHVHSLPVILQKTDLVVLMEIMMAGLTPMLIGQQVMEQTLSQRIQLNGKIGTMMAGEITKVKALYR